MQYIDNNQNAGNNSSYVIGSRRNMSILNKYRSSKGNLIVEVLQYDRLVGSANTNSAENLFFMGQQNIKPRQVAVYVNNDTVKVEAGAMSYLQGPLNIVSNSNGAGNAVGRMIGGIAAGERGSIPEYQGSGVLVLEPSFKHFLVLELNQGETIVADKGMFFLAQGSVDIKPIMNSQISTALLSGEGIFQLQLTGPGLVILESPVPVDEINIIHLDNDILKVDGNFALLRTGNITLSVERSARTLLGSIASGEGLVNVFKGTGDVWVAPTLKIYNALSQAGLHGGDLSIIDTSTGGNRIKTRN